MSNNIHFVQLRYGQKNWKKMSLFFHLKLVVSNLSFLRGYYHNGFGNHSVHHKHDLNMVT